MSDETAPPDSEAYACYEPAAEHAFPDHRLNEVLRILESSEEVQGLLEAQNVNPVTRMGYNDHGHKHIEIVRDRALCLYDLLKRGELEAWGVRDHGLEEADEAVVIAMAATLHDVGQIVHRDNHSHWSVPVAAPVIDRVLQPVYEMNARVKMKGEILHAILCHHSELQPLTKEAGVVRVADGLDMERGRSRRPYEQGGRGINTVSSQAIRAVNLYEGTTVPVRVEIEMTSAAGVYQVDSLLKAKLNGSGLEDVVRIVAVRVASEHGQLVDRLEL